MKLCTLILEMDPAASLQDIQVCAQGDELFDFLHCLSIEVAIGESK